MRISIFRFFVLSAVLLTIGSISYSQTADPNAKFEQDLQLLRKDLRSEKKKFIASNLPLTEAEAIKFWPLYDRYAADLSKNYDQRIALIKEYAANFTKLTDEAASSLNKRWVENERAMAELRQKYIPVIEQTLPGKKAALFFQLDRRLGLLIDLQLASEIPLVSQ
jgi:hypothetical protein